MTSLVTGGAGFIGSNVVRGLVERGERPLVFDLNPSESALAGVTGRIDLVPGDLGNFSQVLNAVKKARPEVIYHLGGMLSAPSEAEPAASLRANALGTFHVLEAARLFEVSKVIFSSTVATYGMDIPGDTIDDDSLQRPFLFYGATKVFGEHMGLFFQRKYGLDFRGLRFPAVVGPGVKTPGLVQYNSWVIERCARGEPFTIWVSPETPHAVLYYKDAVRSVLELGRAPRERLRRATYTLGGIDPPPTAGQLADIVRAHVPGARIDFAPEPEKQRILDAVARPFDDRNARAEWGWAPEFGLEEMVTDFLRELEAAKR